MSTRDLKALVLAGGTGTRLRPLTYTMAKQLVPVGNKPILHYALDSLVEAGVRDIGIIISPETGEQIKEAAKRWCPRGVSLSFILQDEPLGLAHAVKTAQPFLKNSPFVMYLGDNLIQSTLKPLVDEFLSNGCDTQILLKPVENPHAFGVAELNKENQVHNLQEKPRHPKSNLALVGVYLFNPNVFEAIDQIKPSKRGELEITDAIQRLIEMGKPVYPHLLEGWWLDTGKKDDLLGANRLVLDVYCTTNINGRIDKDSQIRGRVEIGQGSRIKNSVIQGPVRIGEKCVIEDAYIGPFTSIADNSKIIRAEVEDSVLLESCFIEDIPVRIEQSLMGQESRVIKNPERPASFRLLLSDQSVVEIL